LAFSCGARSAFKLNGKKELEKDAIAPSDARLCSAAALVKDVVKFFLPPPSRK
jgi:hypothetical protein